MTAPNESTFAFLSDIPHPRLVAPAAAQQPASVEAEGRPIAHSSSRTGNAKSEEKEIAILECKADHP
jgi:hypothetical protein